MRYTKHVTGGTSQSSSIDGNQVQNDAGQYVYEVSDWKSLERFLLLGSENGTYYASERELTKASAETASKLLVQDPARVLKMLAELSEQNRLPKQDPALFVLALACASSDNKTRALAYSLINTIARTATHLFTFVGMVTDLRGWSRGLRTAVSKFYTEKEADQLAYQVLKYRSRNGYSHRDLLRLTHPVPPKGMKTLFKYIAGKFELEGGWGRPQKVKGLPEIVSDFECVQALSSGSRIAAVLKDSELTWEMVPTEKLNDPKVWEALLPNLPYTATLRNLNKLTALGIIGSSALPGTQAVVSRLTNKAEVKKSRVHPAAILNTLSQYSQGRGDKGSLTWNPAPAIVEALETALELSAEAQTPSGKKILIAVDVSGSMTTTKCSGLNITPSQAAAAMAFTILRSEPNAEVALFNTGCALTTLNRKSSFEQVLKGSQVGGGTDCSAPYQFALDNKLPYDAIIVLTDSQTTGGSFHPVETWRMFKRKVNPHAKTIVVGMAANDFTLFEKSDQDALSVAGMDTMVPRIISEFLRDE